MGMGYHSIHAKQAGFLGHRCMTAVTMHGCHEWVYEASEKHQQDWPAWLWQAAYYDTFSFENADLSFFPSQFLRAKVEYYGWSTSRPFRCLTSCLCWIRPIPVVTVCLRLMTRRFRWCFSAASKSAKACAPSWRRSRSCRQPCGAPSMSSSWARSSRFTPHRSPTWTAVNISSARFLLTLRIAFVRPLQCGGAPLRTRTALPRRVPGQPPGELPQYRSGDRRTASQAGRVRYWWFPRDARTR